MSDFIKLRCAVARGAFKVSSPGKKSAFEKLMTMWIDYSVRKIIF